jgi:hypothetical protein
MFAGRRGEKTAVSMLLKVYRAKPNPAGKDRTRSGPIPQQLVAEWVDIKNIGTQSVSFASMELHDTQFGRTCSDIVGTERYWQERQSRDALAPGQILRVHTGSKQYENTLSAEDRGSDVSWRGFADHGNFVLNNVCGDVITVIWADDRNQRWKDSAGYDANPPEGAVLYRVGDRLKPA